MAISRHTYGTLTSKEKEFLRYISKGLKFKQIAEKMHISMNTAGKYATKCNQKMQVHNVSDAAAVAKVIGQI